MRVEPRFIEAVDPCDDALVFRHPCRRQRVEIFAEDRIEPRGGLAFLREPLHPDPVGGEDVVERSVQRAEEGALVFPVLRLGEFRRGSVDAPVGPAVVVGEHPIVIEHQLFSRAVQPAYSAARLIGRAKVAVAFEMLHDFVLKSIPI
ncbi:hypothetical protein AOX55_00001054 [Sinorhizobium fredii CCBAU 25509]|nr:hypothetical protein AOX55_00001054 [Sinorhizobium fredii CCBAU 25509]